MSDPLRTYLKRANFLEVKGDSKNADKSVIPSERKLTHRSDLSPRSSISSPSQHFINLLDKPDTMSEFKSDYKDKDPKNTTKVETFYGKGGISWDAIPKTRTASSRVESRGNIQIFPIEEGKTSAGIQTTPRPTLYNSDTKPLPTEQPLESADTKRYTGLAKLPRIKMPQHFSDVRTAYKMYGEMLKKRGISVEKKLFEISAPPNVKSRFLNETVCYKAKKTAQVDRLNKTMDQAYQIMTEEDNNLANNELFEVTIIFPENINTFDDMGKYYVKLDMWKYWKMHSKHFENATEIFEFQNTMNMLKEKGLFTDLHLAVTQNYEKIMNSTRKDRLIQEPAAIKEKIKVLEQEGLYYLIFDLMVMNYCISKDMNERVMDSIYNEIMLNFEKKYKKKIEVTALLFLDGTNIRNIMEVPLNTEILIAGVQENLMSKTKVATEILVDFKKENYYQTIKYQLKEDWLANNTHMVMDKKDQPHAEYKPMKVYINPVIREKVQNNEPKYRYSAVESFVVGSMKSSTVEYFLNPMGPAYKRSLTTKRERMKKDFIDSKRSSIPHGRRRRNIVSRDAVSRASDSTNFIDIESLSKSKIDADSLKSADASVSISTKFGELIEKTKDYRKRSLIFQAKDQSFDIERRASGLAGSEKTPERKGSQISQATSKKSKNQKLLSMLFEGSKEGEDAEAPSEKLDNAQIKKIMEVYPDISRRDIIEIHSKFITLAELSARRKQIEKQKATKKEKEKLKAPVNLGTIQKFNSVRVVKENWLKERETKIDLSQINLKSLVDLDILFDYSPFFVIRPEVLNQAIVKAASCSVATDPLGVISWENFLSLHVVVIQGLGTKEQKIDFLCKLFCPKKDRLVTKQEFVNLMRIILTCNKKFNTGQVNIDDAIETMWRSDFLPSGCVKDHNFLIAENFKKAMMCDKIFCEVFMQIVNDELEISDNIN